MALKILHIVDVESTGGTLRSSGLAKGRDILSWKDSLSIGPVPAGLSLKELSEVNWRTGIRRSRDLVRINIAVPTQPRADSDLVSHQHPQLSLVTAYGGIRREQELHQAHVARKPVRAAQVRVATRFWDAFTSATPMLQQRLLKRDLRALPEVQPTINELLQDYPSARDGLSHLERKLLLEIDAMGTTSAAFAVGSVIRREWVGDMLLFDMVRRFVAARNPLLRFAAPFTGRFQSYEFNGAKLALTAMEREVLAGTADHIALKGIDRWIGGVHLHGTRVRWRWDEHLQRIIRTAR